MAVLFHLDEVERERSAVPTGLGQTTVSWDIGIASKSVGLQLARGANEAKSRTRAIPPT